MYIIYVCISDGDALFASFICLVLRWVWYFTSKLETTSLHSRPGKRRSDLDSCYNCRVKSLDLGASELAVLCFCLGTSVWFWRLSQGCWLAPKPWKEEHPQYCSRKPHQHPGFAETAGQPPPLPNFTLLPLSSGLGLGVEAFGAGAQGIGFIWLSLKTWEHESWLNKWGGYGSNGHESSVVKLNPKLIRAMVKPLTR